MMTNHFLHTLTVQANELEQTKLQLQKTNHLLASAENKLGFLNQHTMDVQVTAFTGQGSFCQWPENRTVLCCPPSHLAGRQSAEHRPFTDRTAEPACTNE